MRISYELEDRYAVNLTQKAEACGLDVDSLTHQIVVKFLQEVQPDEGGASDERVPFNSLEGAENLDWSDEPRISLAMNRHLAETFALGE